MYTYQLVLWAVRRRSGKPHSAGSPPSQLFGPAFSRHQCRWWCISCDANLNVILVSITLFHICHVTWCGDLTGTPGLHVGIHVLCWPKLYLWSAQHIMTAFDLQVGLAWGLAHNYCSSDYSTFITCLQPAHSIVTDGLLHVLLCFHFK